MADEPAGSLTDTEVEDLLEHLDALLERIERATGPVAEVAGQAVRALAEVYGTALARVMARVGGDVRPSLVQDELVHHLLVLHGIHPQPIEERVARALEELRSHGDEVELAAIDDGVARLRWSNARGCASSAAGVERAIGESVLASAPELRGVEVLAAPDRRPSPAVIPAESLLRKPAASRSRNATP